MPWSSSALRRSAIASASVFSPHQPVEIVHVPKPTSLMVTPLVGRMRVFMSNPPNATSASRAVRAQALRRVHGKIGDDHVGAGATNADERLHHRAISIYPATLGRGPNHSVLATHLIGGQRMARLRLHARDDVEIRTRRLHHDHVRTLGDVLLRLAN